IEAWLPRGELIQAVDGNFYGTTPTGGQYGGGTVFMMDSSGHVTVLHSFGRYDGSNPAPGVTQGSDGALYGTTGFAATLCCSSGVVFRLSVSAFNHVPAITSAVAATLTVGNAGTFV